MQPLLALRLVTVPERAWSDVSAACKTEEGLPPPIVSGGLAALVSVIASAIGAAVLPEPTVNRVVVWSLVAAAGYFGSVAAAIALPAHRLGVPPETVDLVPRFVVSSALPIAASGWFNFVPFVGLTFVWTVAMSALTFRCASVGAGDWLRLEGEARSRAAMLVTGITVLPVLFTIGFRALFEK